MTTEFGEMKEVIVTPEMLNRYFFMNKTEILVHLFLLSVCDSDRHVERNVHALSRETETWRSDLYRALMELSTKSMVEEKQLKTKDGRFWRVYPLPRTRQSKKAKEDNIEQDCYPPNSQANLDACTSNQSVKGNRDFNENEEANQSDTDKTNSDKKNSSGILKIAKRFCYNLQSQISNLV